MVTLESDERARGKGTAMWCGAANSFWWIDRAKGVCGVFGTQMVPAGDDGVRDLMKAWEGEVYRRVAEAGDGAAE